MKVCCFIRFPYRNLAWLILGALLLICDLGFSQNQSVADSLKAVYLSGDFEEGQRLRILSKLAADHPNPDSSLVYSEELIRRAITLDSSYALYRGYLQRGNSLRLKGDLTEALETYFKGVKIISNNPKKRDDLSSLYISIASVYASMGNEQNTVGYYKNAIKLLSELKGRWDSIGYASAIENLGDAYNLEFGRPDTALVLFKESEAIWKALDYKIGMAYNLGNIGLAYAQLGKTQEAEIKVQGAIAILEELGDYYPICVYLTYMADFSADRNEWILAFEYAERSLHLAKQNSLKEQIGDAYLKLSELHERRGDMTKSLAYYKNHITYRDSVQNISAVQQMANFEMAQKQKELDISKQRQKTQKVIGISTAIALFLIFLLAIGLYRRNVYIKKTKSIIEEERDRSDGLLLNILPEKTAQELKEFGTVKANKFNSVTVLFTDFVAFTRHSENLDPELLVESIGFYFTAFDDIIEKYGLEKIKTIGDSYMCAGGLPFASKGHAQKMIQAAYEIVEFVEEAKRNRTTYQMRFDVRIGINTGPVVAGVVGSKKFSYDIWGDTVNVASRMEGMSEAGKINISENTYEIVKDSFECEYRGEIAVKNRGSMKMYFLGNAVSGAGSLSSMPTSTSA